MSPAAETAAWVAGIWTAIALAAWIRHRRQQSRTARVRQQRTQRIADINARLRGMPAAPDDQPGTRLDWQDLCERIWSAPFDPQTGLDRLRKEIQQQKEEDR